MNEFSSKCSLVMLTEMLKSGLEKREYTDPLSSSVMSEPGHLGRGGIGMAPGARKSQLKGGPGELV